MKNKVILLIVIIVIFILTAVAVFFKSKSLKEARFYDSNISEREMGANAQKTNQEAEVRTDDSVFIPNKEVIVPGKEKTFFNIDLNNIPAIIYTEEIGKYETSGRSYPRLAVWRKIGNDVAEKLVEVGKVGEYPYSVKISPDNKHLFINLESKIQTLNLTNNELKDFFIPQKRVYSMEFSSDGKSLFVWDAIYASMDNESYLQRINLQTGESDILKHGNDGCAYFLSEDSGNKIMLGFPGGEVAGIGYFDFDTGGIVDLGKNDPSIFIGFGSSVSKSGKFATRANSSAADICNDFSGSANDGYEIIDLISKEHIGQVKIEGTSVSVLFSPDEKSVLYSGLELAKSKKDCENLDADYVYYVADITGKNSQKITQEARIALLKKWNGGLPNIDQKFKGDGGKEILVDGNVFMDVSSQNNVNVVGGYFLKK